MESTGFSFSNSSIFSFIILHLTYPSGWSGNLDWVLDDWNHFVQISGIVVVYMWHGLCLDLCERKGANSDAIFKCMLNVYGKVDDSIA